MNAALSKEDTFSHKADRLCNPIFPARAASFAGCVHNARVGLFLRCSGGNIVAVAAAFVAVTVMFSGCAPVYANGAPLATPALHGTHGTDGTNGSERIGERNSNTTKTKGLAGGPSNSEPADVREPAVGEDAI